MVTIQKYKKKGQIFLLLAMFASIQIVGCGGKSKKTTPKEILARSGSEVESTSIKYLDRDPVISAAGDRILYVSGRESTSTKINLKVYRIDWPTSQAPKEAIRLTNEDLGQEEEVALSPNGQLAAIEAVKDSQKDIFLQPIVAEGAPSQATVPLTKNKNIETIGEFSPDSKYFAWISRSGTKSQFHMVSISQALQNPLGASIQIGSDFSGLGILVWLPTTDPSTYRLLLGKSGTAGMFSFDEAQFTDPNSITLKTVTLPSPFTNGVILKKGSKLRASKKHIFLVQDVTGSISETMERVGDAPVPQNGKKEKTASFSKTLVFDHSSYAAVPIQDPQGEPIGTDTLAISWNSEGSFGVLLNRSYYQCQEDPKPVFGTGILFADSKEVSPSTLPKFVRKSVRFAGIENVPVKPVPPKDPDESKLPEQWRFVLKDGFCGRKIENENIFERMDHQITHLAVNSLATQDQMRMVYASRFVPRVDSKCEIKGGDLEVRAMEWKDKSATFFSPSPNRALIKNAPAQEGECTVYWSP